MREQLNMHPASGVELYHPIMNPDALAFSDVFSEWLPYQAGKFDMPAQGELHTYVSGYCNRRDGESLSVRPRQWVLDVIRDRMIDVPNDRLSFEIVDHEGEGEKWSLVIIKHGQIIGSRWLAYIRTATIPGGGK